MEKYFHELDSTEYYEIYNKKIHWSKIAKKYPQPPWCKHPNAVAGLFGCEDLIAIRSVKNEEDCTNCMFYKYMRKD